MRPKQAHKQQSKYHTKGVKDRLKHLTDTSLEEEQLNTFLKIDQTIKLIKKANKELRNTVLTYIDDLIAKQVEYEYLDEIIIVRQYLQLMEDIANANKAIRETENKLDLQLLAFYPSLTAEKIKQGMMQNLLAGRIRLIEHI